ncbi:MAG: STAS domain-containing protein [SAR324 cluster bacterium]|nr:STAS domain-containing protein [SAR324 cluster bacterium]
MMNFNYCIKKNICIFSIEGRFIEDEASEFESCVDELLDNPECQAFLINLKDTRYVTSLGVGMLIIFFKKAHAKSTPFGLCHVNDEIYNSFKSSNLQKILPIYKTEDDGLMNLG